MVGSRRAARLGRLRQQWSEVSDSFWSGAPAFAEGERASGKPDIYLGEASVYRIQLRRKAGFLNCGYIEGCSGCQAALSGTSRQRHFKTCRSRMEVALPSSLVGQARAECQEAKANQKLERSIEEPRERDSKLARV